MTRKIYGSTLVAFGDSITRGIGVPEDMQKWTEIIREGLAIKLVNSGIGGNTSLQGLERIDKDVLSYKPDFVTICFGMNDHCMISKGEPKVSINNYENAIISMINRIRQIDAIPLLVTPNYIIEGNKKEYYYSRHDRSFYKDAGGAQAWLDRYNDIIRVICARENVGLIDIRRECEKYNPYQFLRSLKNDSFADGVHPHTLGASVYAKVIGDYLKANFT